jgi:hypothetical protein
MSLTPLDHLMIDHATNQGEVIVTEGERQRLGRLIAWKPRRRNDTRRRSTARVEFSGNHPRSVPVKAVTIPDHVQAEAKKREQQ